MTFIRTSGLLFFGLATTFGMAFVACGDSNTSGSGGAGSGGAPQSSNNAGAPPGTGGSTSQAEGGGGSGGKGGAAQGGGGAGTGGSGGAAQGGGGSGGAGACAGVVCTAKDQCHGVGKCDAQTGKCSDPELSDGTSCDDMVGCSIGDTCQTGVCKSATGDGALDQSCLPTAGVDTISPEHKPGQSFKANKTGQLMSVELALEKCSTPNIGLAGKIRLDVYDASNALKGTARVDATTITHDCTVFDLTAACIAVAAGDVLRVELSEEGIASGVCSANTHFCTAGLGITTRCDGDADCDITFGASEAGSDLYSGGSAFDNGAAVSANDLDFKTVVR
jgi:hypothetical protein